MINQSEHRTEKPGKPLNLYSTIGSVLLHFIVFFGLIVFIRIAENYSGASYGGYYVDMVSPRGASAGSLKPEEQNIEEQVPRQPAKEEKESLPDTKTRTLSETEKVRAGKDEAEKENTKNFSKEGSSKVNYSNAGSGGYYNMNSGGFDSTGLSQIYQEPTLKVRLNYPAGWIYMDQQRRRKLDGITFWASVGSYNPPPYIHVEVVEKYIFNPDQYKYKYDFNRFTGYYNDPEEMENQVSQTIYIRTGDDEDYSIKLIMNGKDAFKEFQPVFFAMVKSFRFGNSLF